MSASRIVGFGAGLMAIYFANGADPPTPANPDPVPPHSAPHPNHRITTKPIDFTRPLNRDDLVAAGQLGGPLFPTHVLNDKQRQRAAEFDFGKGIEEWNNHAYAKSVAMFRKHVEQFPDSPWAGEAVLHVGCDASYNGRYTEAETIFRRLMAEHEGKDYPGAKMLLNKARQRLALLKVNQNNLDEASGLFTALLESPDWRHRTYAAHWLQRTSRYKGAQQALLTCGVEALTYAIQRNDAKRASLFPRAGEGGGATAHIRTNIPPTMRGHSLAHLLRLATDHGYEMAALQVNAADLPRLPLPAVLHIVPQHDGDKGHYWVLDKVDGDRLEIFDPQSEHRFQQTTADLAREWSGKVLVFSSNIPLPGRRLEPHEMDDSFGGCCGAPRPEDDLGDECQNTVSGWQNNNCSSCSQGAPIWKVNVVNLNHFVTDTPLWYESAIGPDVRITVSYNSQSAIAMNEPFGNKWQFNYGSYLIMDTSGSVIIFMPDGRRDVFNPDGRGGYIAGFRVRSTLRQLSPSHFELRFLDGTVYEYQIPAGTTSQQPFLVAIRDPHEQALTFTYDSDVNLTTITDAQGKLFQLQYNERGLCTNVADPFGRNAAFSYDSDRNLTNVVDMGGYWSSFTYDSNMYLTSIGNARGAWKFRTEPADGVQANGDNYPAPGDPMWENYRLTITDPLGQIEEFYYYGGCGEGICDGYTWHVRPRDYIIWSSQSRNTFGSTVPKTFYFLDRNAQHGTISKLVKPDGGFIAYSYDSNTGDRVAVNDSEGRARAYTYNSLGAVSSITDPRTNTTYLSYAPSSLDLLSVSNGLGAVEMEYNSVHGLIRLVDRATNTTSITRNSYGQITSIVDAQGRTNEYYYDGEHRLSEVRRSGFRLEAFTYDTVGRVRSITGRSGLTLTNTYNDLNQIVRVTYQDNRYESYVYSTCCPRLLESVTSRGGRTVHYSYDAKRRLVQALNAEGGVTQFAYDQNDNLVRIADPNGNFTTFVYDLNDRPIRKTYADGRGISGAYDSAGRLITITNARGSTISFRYDASDNLLEKSYSDDTYTVVYDYDNFDRLLVSADSNGTNRYAYDRNSRIVEYDGPWANDTIRYYYDELGRLTNTTVQNGQTVHYAYDELDRVRDIRSGSATFAYSYIGVSGLPQRIDRPNGGWTRFRYDEMFRLEEMGHYKADGILAIQYLQTFNEHDLIGSQTISGLLATSSTSASVVPYHYNTLNQLENVGGSPISYDADGNMTIGLKPDGGAFRASYDAENRLRSISFTNGNGLLVERTNTYVAGGFLNSVSEAIDHLPTSTLYFVRDGIQTKEERDATGQTVRAYLWGLELGGGIGGLLQITQNHTNYSVLSNTRGDVQMLLDANDGAAATFVYDEFGVLTGSFGQLDEPYKFSTKYYDHDVGLTYFGFRHYSALLGRWLSRDALGEFASLNLYSFVNNDPVNRIDPFGADDALPMTDFRRQMWEFEDRQKASRDARDAYEAELHRQHNMQNQKEFPSKNDFFDRARDLSKEQLIDALRENSDMFDNACKAYGGLNRAEDIYNCLVLRQCDNLSGQRDLRDFLSHESTRREFYDLLDSIFGLRRRGIPLVPR